MNISKFVTDSGIIIFRISGKLISSTTENLKASLDTAMEGEALKIVINCKGVGIIDSAAVGLLISRSRLVKKKGGHFCFCEPQQAIQKLFTILDVDKWVEIFPTESEAVESIQAGVDNKPAE